MSNDIEIRIEEAINGYVLTLVDQRRETYGIKKEIAERYIDVLANVKVWLFNEIQEEMKRVTGAL